MTLTQPLQTYVYLPGAIKPKINSMIQSLLQTVNQPSKWLLNFAKLSKMVKRLQIHIALLESFKVLLGLFLVLCQLLITLVILPLIFAYRWLLISISRYFEPSLAEIVYSRDNFFASENFTSGNPSRAVIVVCATLEGHVSLEEARNLVLHNFVCAKENEKFLHPKLRQYITTWPSILGFRFWKWERGFRINKHVDKFQPSENFTDGQLDSWIETLLNEPFESERSPWKVFITNNYINSEKGGGNMTIVTLKAHHCLADGYGLFNTVIETLGTGMSVVQPSKANGIIKGNAWESFLSNVTFPFRSLYELSDFIMLTFRSHPWKISDEKKSFNQLYSKSPTISVDKIKAIKNKFQVSFTSVVMAAYASASRKTLERCRGKRGKKVGDWLPSAVILPLPDHPKNLRNHCTGAYISLPTMECSSIERLLECEWQVNGAKRSVLPFFASFFTMLYGSFPMSLTRHIAKNRQFPVGISNFPCGNEKYKLLNRNMLDMTMGAGAQTGVAGLNFFVYAYDTGIQFTVTSAASLMSREELNYMTQCIVDEIDHLYSVNVV